MNFTTTKEYVLESEEISKLLEEIREESEEDVKEESEEDVKEESEEDIKEESEEDIKEESEEDIKEESEEDIDEEDIKEENKKYNGNYFLKDMIYEDEHKKLFKTDARDFIPVINIWAQQRQISKEHIKKLEKEVISKKHFKGNMKLLRDKDNNCRLIDGQHRYHALKNIMEKDSKFNIYLILEIYETDSFDSDKSIEIFKEVNNCLNVELNDLPDKQSINLLKELIDFFPKMIKDVKEGKRVNSPCINKRILYNQLKKYFTYSKCDYKNILKQIVETNNKYGMRGRNGFKKSTVKQYEKAKKKGFYLGLDKDFIWVNKLDW